MRDRTDSQGAVACSSLLVVVQVVSSTTRGAIQALRVLLKSLLCRGRMGSCYMVVSSTTRGTIQTLRSQGAAPWSLSGFRGSWVVSSAMYSMRVYSIICRDTGSRDAVQCYLGIVVTSSIVSYGVVMSSAT